MGLARVIRGSLILSFSTKVFCELGFVSPSVCFIFQFYIVSTSTVIAPSFVALAIFYYINARLELGNGELGLENFLYYFKARRLPGNNWPVKGLKEWLIHYMKPANPYYYKKWLIHCIQGISYLLQSTNKIKFLTSFEARGEYYSKGCQLTQQIIKKNSKFVCSSYM